MKVVEIFNSIEGEGIRAGLPCTFIRLFGCNLKCSYCDSRYACEGNDYSVMSIKEICNVVKMYQCKRITLTGGEPLIHPGVYTLIQALLDEGYFVNVETNGSKEPRLRHEHLFYTVDFKTKSSGVSDKMEPGVFGYSLEPTDVVKFVVGSTEDLDQALEVVEKYDIKSPVFVSPVFGKIEAVRIVEYIQNHKLWDWRVQLQMHKYIWDPDQKGV